MTGNVNGGCVSYSNNDDGVGYMLRRQMEGTIIASPLLITAVTCSLDLTRITQ